MFENISISGWRQFDSINIDFHKRLTILTGANASGKTTILRILSQHFGWDLSFKSVVNPNRKIDEKIDDFWGEKIQIFSDGQRRNMGYISYTDNNQAEISTPSYDNSIYGTQIFPMKPIPGLFIPSHRPIPVHSTIGNISLQPQTKRQAFENYKAEVRRIHGSGKVTFEPPSLRMKQTLISLATFGYGNKVVKSDQQAIDTFEGFQEILMKVLPPKIGFEKLYVELPEVILDTRTGKFTLDSMSGGIASIIDIAWQIYMYSEENKSYVVIIDEPENHLHPELQRMLLPNLMDAFPNVQFIVATHNPFIIGSTRDSNIYVLDYNENNKVYSQLLDTANRSGTSNEILRNVLGLDDTLPIWVSEKLDDIINKYSELDFSNENIEDMRIELEESGLDNVITQAIVRVIGKGEK